MHNRRSLMTMRILACALCAVVLTAATRAQRPAPEEAAITGEVLSPKGVPVSGGNIALMTAAGTRVTGSIDKAGRFRIVPDSQGWMRLFISVPGFEPSRANVTVNSSRKMTLPPITLREATYFRVRFVSVDGEALPAAGFRHRLIDADGLAIPDPLGHVQLQAEQDGTITLGPLPRGRMTTAFDRAPFAPTRLPDVNVTGSQRLIDRGTVTIQPASQMLVDVVDSRQRAAPNHEVWIEDATQPSMLSYQPVTTNAEGRAVFTRLGSGRYRVWTRAPELCGVQAMLVSRLASASTGSAAAVRLVVGGTAALRITTVLGPLFNRRVSLSHDAPGEAPWRAPIINAMRVQRGQVVPSRSSSCSAVTDNEGRVTLTSFPPGAAHAHVQLFNSTYIAGVNVPENTREIPIAVPDGLMQVHVIDRVTRQPIAASLVWAGGSGRVEVTATANGDALLEGVGNTGGTLTISHREYQTLEGAFEETPGTAQEVALLPLPSARVPVRVLTSDGAAIPDAVVELWTAAGDAAEFAATDAKGVATLTDVPPGTLRLTAHANGYAPVTVPIPEESRSSIEIRLK